MEANDYLAIDIGGTRIKYAVLDHAGNLIEKDDVATPNESLAEFVATVHAIVDLYCYRIKGSRLVRQVRWNIRMRLFMQVVLCHS